MGTNWGGEILWDPDALFYQARVEHVRGEQADAALQQVFRGPRSARARRIEADFEERRRLRDPAWPAYSQRFYNRRWLVPLVAAGLYPVLGDHSLETLSLLGYVAVAPLLFLLLRRRFQPLPSFVVAVTVAALPPLREWSVFPLTDSASLALLIAGLLSAVLVVERGMRWLPLWLMIVAALAFTRDTAVILVVAAGVLALVRRDRRAAALALGGAAAAAPAPLLFGASARDLLAYVLSHNTVPSDASWGFVLREYAPSLDGVAQRYLDYAATNPHVVLFFLVGLGCVLWLAPAGDPFFTLLQASIAGYLLLLALAPAFSGFRYELVLVPAAAAGLALGADRVRDLRAHARAAPTETHP